MRKQTTGTVIIGATLALCFLNGCSETPAGYRPTSTVKEIMDSMVDPGADGLWDAVEVVATLEGTVEKQPRTDDDWKALRRHAITLAEASNLLLIPGRAVARPGETAEDPRVDLHPEEIEALIRKDPDAWIGHVHHLHDAAMTALAAIDARDLKTFIDAGETLDQACETCHKNYWYRVAPVDPAAGPAFRAGER